MIIRDFKGRFASKASSVMQNHKKIVTTLVIIGAIGVINSVDYGVHFYESHNPLAQYQFNIKKVFASEATYTAPVATTTPSLNSEIEKFAEARTQLMMKDPTNLKEYHDAVYTKVVKAMNILTTTY